MRIGSILNKRSANFPKNTPNRIVNSFLFVVAAALVIAVGSVTTPYMAAATFAYLLILAGFSSRKTSPIWHSRFMGVGIFLDFTLVLLLEFQRSAVATAVGDEMNVFQQAHVVFSVIAVICYIPLILLGIRLLGKRDFLTYPLHKWIGICAFIARSAGFILMFSLIDRVSGQ